MQIVIDIPNEDINAIKIMGLQRTQEEVQKRVDSAIQHGTPLPKGHGKLIDSNILWDAFQDLGQDFYEAVDFAEANAVIEADEEV